MPGYLANVRGAEGGNADEGNLHRAQGGEGRRPDEKRWNAVLALSVNYGKAARYNAVILRFSFAL